MSKKSIMGGGARHASKSKNLKTFVALGLSSILPSLAFSSESNEALNQLLTTAPQAPSDSKTQKMENYSPVVDLRSSRAITNDGSIFNNNPVNITQDTTIGTEANRWDVTTGSRNTKASKDIIIADNTTLTMTATNNGNYGYIFATSDRARQIAWSGGNIVIDFLAAGYGGIDHVKGGLLAAEATVFRITSNLDYTYRNNSSGTGTGAASKGVSAIDASYDGVMKLLGSKIKINAIGGTQKQNVGLGIFSLMAHDGGTIYLNANDDGSIYQNAIIQIDGSLSTGLTKNNDVLDGNGKIYANFTGTKSYLNGNIYSGRYNGGSRLVANFISGATMTGDIVFLGDSNPTSKITFSSGSKLTGDINALASGNHTVIFNNANFAGTIKSNSEQIQNTTIGSGTGNDVNKALGTMGNGSNTLVSFINTGGKEFGNGTADIVDVSYLGKITGTFDLSANSTTVIKGGNQGSYGFKGKGTNTLVFDFKGNMQTQAQNKFTIGGGNTDSIYVMNSFTQDGQNAFDYSAINSSSSLFTTLESAGIKVVVDTQNSDNLTGTLFFQNTNITVGSGALFDNSENIVGSSNSLNGLALGAMFGNATWNDANKDGAISQNEIISNGGAVYKLSGTNGTAGNTADDKTSTGNIGQASDGIKKHVAFIFADGTEQNGYVFNGDKQGYSGTIAGGTTDSKYYFANAGYINRTQIDNALGDLVLFNTAFRGDLGVKNKDVSIFLDFSNNRNGLRAENGEGNANIVGAGNKNITFNFTGNTNAIKFTGSVIGDANKTDGDSNNASSLDNGTAKYTMLNLVKYSANGVKDGDGSLKVSGARAGSNKTLIDAIQEAGLSNFNKNQTSSNYPSDAGKTDVSAFSTTNTTLALRGTSLDTANIVFNNYVYDLAFGEGIGELEGVAISNSTLKGDIDLSSNTNTGHKIILKGNALASDAVEIKFNATNFGASGGGVFVYDDSTATYSTPKTLKLSGISQTNYLKDNSAINITHTNLEGDLYSSWESPVNLNFTNGNTWKMDNSGIYLRGGSNIVIHGKVSSLANNGNDTPTLKLRHDNNVAMGNLEFINTGMTVKLWQKGGWGNGTRIGSTFNFRGTSLETFWSDNTTNGSQNGLHGYADNGINLVFAKGTNLDTIQTKADNGGNYKITDEGVGEGDYIAESYGRFTKIVTSRSFNATFIGEQSHNADIWQDSAGRFGQNSTLTFVNASNGTTSNSGGLVSGALDATKIGYFLNDQNDNETDALAVITIEGTSIANGNSIVARTAKQDKLTFDMTFVNESGSGNNTDTTYVGDKYADLATTNANGALANNVLKVAESSLVGGIDFKGANFDVLFVGDASQSLGKNGSNSQMNVFKGGTASSILTFRDSDLNAGNGTTSSIQNIKGTIAFDLSHASEDMSISGTLKNMFADNGHYQTKFGQAGNTDSLTFDNLVFVSMNNVTSANALASLKSNGNYFGDKDTFGDLSQKDFSKLGYISDLNTSENSSLTFGGGEIALNGTNQEIYFIGENSHGFDADNGSATKLGDSTGSTLTFIDAGTLKVDNLINKDSSNAQTGKGTINLIGKTSIELKGTDNKTLTLYDANTGAGGSASPITGEGITINAVFTGSNVLGTGVEVKDKTGSNNASDISGNVASNTNIGSNGEQTVYHILFDYTDTLGNKTNKGFGDYQVYQGNITGLTSASVIKFKNAGYIDGTQIENTDATIYLDNTQLKADFRNDNAVLDFRNGRATIAGNILTSDVRATDPNGTGGKPTANVLSQKVLAFDLTNTTGTKLNYNYAIQAGYKVATAYANNAQSVLTFQNASTMTLGDDNGSNLRGARTANSSAFIQSLASDVGFSGIANAETEETGFNNSTSDKKSYILKGTKLVFQGTSITASGDKAISENLYELDLSFDTTADRGNTALDETLNSSTLTANSITMGSLSTNGGNPLSLALSFKGANSLNADGKKLDVKVKENANFNLKAEGNEKIGTIVLSQNSDNGFATLANVATESSMSISAGSMDFVGQFIQAAPQGGATAGAINVAFNGTNKAYGVIAGQGAMNVTISGDALFTDNEATKLGYTKDGAQFADLVIDFSNADSTSAISLAHTSGMVGVAGNLTGYTNINLSQAKGNVALKNNFNLTEGATFDGSSSSHLQIQGNLKFKIAGGKTLNITEDGILTSTSAQSPTPSMEISVLGAKGINNIVLTNLGDKISNVTLTNSDGWGVGGNWNIRGTNVTLSTVVAENDGSNGHKKTFVFAKGEGTTTSDGTKLKDLNNSDKIADSSLQFSRNASIFGKGSVTLIGKESLAGSADSHKLDGSVKSNNQFTIGLYNTILQSGDVLLDNTNKNDWGDGIAINDNVQIYGTDVFNLSAKKTTITTAHNNPTEHPNNSTITAVFVNGSNLTTTAKTADTAITGNTYINATAGANEVLKTTLAQYATSNAGGALTSTELKTLQSKAYGNIALENTVTANMKFIGDNSHSFDGKILVKGSGTSAEFYAYAGSGATSGTTNAEWKKLEITDGIVSFGSIVTNPSGTANDYHFATLSGGNDSSRFDFDHTSVSLELIKDAGGKTYVYNSDVIGAINVGNTPSADSSTTLIFNAKMTKKQASDNRAATAADQTLSLASQAYIANTLESKGINIDFSTAHQLVADNLGKGTTSDKTLENTSKTTNLIFIGKDSVNTGNTTESNNPDDSGVAQSIDISFMPDTTPATGYSYTFIDAGDFADTQIAAKGFGNNPSNSIDKPSGSDMTIFGQNKVVLVNTYVIGARDFAQQGFIDAGESRNQKSTWGGADGIEQFLIFDFQAGVNNSSLKANSNTGTISNEDKDSRYIFTNMFAGAERVLTLDGSADSLKTKINDKLKGSNASTAPVIGDTVKGYLGLRGVSIKGNINEATNGVDIVFNSTNNISYIDGFDENGNHTATIQNTGHNKIANAYGINNDKSNISGYATLQAADNQSEVTISGAANKSITFIGANSVSVGFDNLKIQNGGDDSTYTFYEVGTLSQTFLTNVGLYNSSQNAQATAGSFTFENTTIKGDINVDQNTQRSDNSANVLTFKNVDYSGTISGSLKKDLSFGANTNNVSISGGSDDSRYDFSNLSGRSIDLDINMSSTQGKYLASSVAGFENGDISLVGSIKLAKDVNELSTPNQDYTNSFAFNNDASWTVTGDSRVMDLSLSNSGLNYNLDLASAPRTATKTDSKDLRVLEVGNLTSNGGQVLLGTQIDESNQANSKSDKIKASVINQDSTLYVTAQDASLNKGNFATDGDNAIVLVTAENSYGEVKGAERKQGLSYVITELEHQVSSNGGSTWSKADENVDNTSNSHRWVLSSFGAETNQELVDESGFIVSNPYRMLMIETNNLNKRMGDLRDDNYNQGAWIRVFNGMDSGEGAKNLYTNIQLGYDYGTPAIGAKNYSGVAFSTSIVDIDGNQYSGKANTYSLAAYNAYIADSGLYVDTIAKYLYTDQKITPAGSSDSSFGSHALSLGVEVGYRAYMGETNFYIEPQAEAIGGIIFGVKDINMGVIGGVDVTGELKTTTTVNTRVGLVQGYSLKTQSGFRADFRLGVSLVNEFVSESDPVRLYDGITEASTSIGNDTKAVVNVGTNLILTDQWRVYIDAERSFGGARNVDYQANIGARFSFGDKLTSLPKPEKPLPLKLKSEEKKEQDKATLSNTQEAKQ